jgi:hypothetical protein
MNALVVTVMSNMGLDIMAREKELQIVKTKVGDRYVLEEMLKAATRSAASSPATSSCSTIRQPATACSAPCACCAPCRTASSA